MGAFKTRVVKRALTLALLSVFAAACGPDNQELRITVYANEPIVGLHVTVLRNDTSGNREVEPFRSTPGYEPGQAIGLVVLLASVRDVVVHIRAQTPDGRNLVAVRCYTVSGVVHDPEVVLVPIDSSMDMDGDHWVHPDFAETICRDRAPGSTDGLPFEDAPCAFGCPAGLSLGSDCNDTDSSIRPGARAICEDGIDQNCTGMDEPCEDQDGDGWTACGPGQTRGCDCDDFAPLINPDIIVDPRQRCDDASRTRVRCESDTDCPSGHVCLDRACACVACLYGVDQNCDNSGSRCDFDGDGYVASRATGGAPDCDDTDPEVYPGAPEICNGKDNDCNGLIDDAPECLGTDADGDGSDACAFVLDANGDYVLDEDGRPLLEDGDCDCNDCDAGIRPGYPEICGNGIDDNCNGEIDEGCPENDMDSDGFAPPTDCNDMDPVAYPGSPFDRCENGFAEDCETSDRSCADDRDGDGFIEPEVCDADPNVNPDVEEVCDGIDNNCSPVPNPTGSGVVFVVDEVGDRTHRRADGEVYPPGTWGCIRGVGLARAVSFQSDTSHCGGCRVTCPAGRANACVGGVCDCSHEDGVASCDRGETCCPDGGCVNVETDPNHCGGCGIECGPEEVCAGGRCTCGGNMADRSAGPVCTVGDEPSCCGEACADLRTNRENCGECGNDCGPNATCQGGECQCNPGFADCDGVQATGCEVDTRTDSSHCGGCGVACMLNNATSNCVASQCEINACNPGFRSCDSSDNTGCETDIRQVANCGDCGNNCPSMACGAWGACGGFTGICGNNGTQARTCFDRTCSESGVCGFNDRIETRACSRNTNGAMCGERVCPPTWGACESPMTCSTSGTQTRTCQDRTCGSGTCNDVPVVESRSCTRDPTGATCSPTTCGDWSACSGFSGTCGTNGTRTRTCTDHTCGGGSCQSSSRMESEPCTRVTDGNPCGNNQVCQGGTCNPCASGYTDCDGSTAGCETHTAMDRDNCGGCDVVCPPNAVCVGGACQCPGGESCPAEPGRRCGGTDDAFCRCGMGGPAANCSASEFCCEDDGSFSCQPMEC